MRMKTYYKKLKIKIYQLKKSHFQNVVKSGNMVSIIFIGTNVLETILSKTIYYIFHGLILSSKMVFYVKFAVELLKDACHLKLIIEKDLVDPSFSQYIKRVLAKLVLLPSQKTKTFMTVVVRIYLKPGTINKINQY